MMKRIEVRGKPAIMVLCHHCNGKGLFVDCALCAGWGWVLIYENINVVPSSGLPVSLGEVVEEDAGTDQV